MFFQKDIRYALEEFLQKINLSNAAQDVSSDKQAKIGQILSYMNILHAQVRHYSTKRQLVIVDCGAGNCYLSFLVYYFYKHVRNRPIRIYCVDRNERLMQKNADMAKIFGFDHMSFHAADIVDFSLSDRADVVYSLHACNTATDKTLFWGIQNQARAILSVSCCQHSLMKKIKGRPYTGITRHHALKKKLAYMIGDAQRALLVEMQGYSVDIIEFASSRYTDKNVMLRARFGQKRTDDKLIQEYQALQRTFKLAPALEKYIKDDEHLVAFSDDPVMTACRQKSA